VEIGRMMLTGEYSSSHQRRTCPSATLSTRNPKLIGLGLNLDVLLDKPAANRLNTRFQFLLGHESLKSTKVIE
jgi:hypothetical protein